MKSSWAVSYVKRKLVLNITFEVFMMMKLKKYLLGLTATSGGSITAVLQRMALFNSLFTLHIIHNSSQ
jgi:hypothetical protein